MKSYVKQLGKNLCSIFLIELALVLIMFFYNQGVLLKKGKPSSSVIKKEQLELYKENKKKTTEILKEVTSYSKKEEIKDSSATKDTSTIKKLEENNEDAVFSSSMEEEGKQEDLASKEDNKNSNFLPSSSNLKEEDKEEQTVEENKEEDNREEIKNDAFVTEEAKSQTAPLQKEKENSSSTILKEKEVEASITKETPTTAEKKKPEELTRKNGWQKVNGQEYYYQNGKKLTNTYVDYAYLNAKGEKEKKIGSFSATLYGASAWANQNLNIRSSSSSSSNKIGVVPTGGKVTILSSENATTNYIKIKYGTITGYVYSFYLMINLPDVIPDMYYNITNASSSIYQSASQGIDGVTGKNLYGFTQSYNKKIGKTTYYVPLLYPVAKQLQKAYLFAQSEGYNLKVYDSYRPYGVTKKIYTNFSKLYQRDSRVKQKVNYDKNGNYWGPSWFLAQSYSNHNKGIAVDIALTDLKGTDLKAQSVMHTLDTSSVVTLNNGVANKLKSIMVKAGFETLKSEWWHFEEANYKSSPVNSFQLK